MITTIIGWALITIGAIWLSVLAWFTLFNPFGNPDKQTGGFLVVLAALCWWAVYCLSPFTIILGSNQ